MKPDTIIFHYSEIALKTGNRLFFERTLARNVERMFASLGVHEVRLARGRIIAALAREADRAALAARVRMLFGAVHATLAVRVEPDVEAMTAAAIALVSSHAGSTFKMDVRRSDKRFPKTSTELNAALGAAVIASTGKKVAMHAPSTICTIELLDHGAYVSVDRLDGPGGLPTGSQSPLLIMLSGGIDSPVAALRMQRRGAPVVAIHFHSYPFTSRASLDKVKELAAVLALPQGACTVYFVPLAEIQKAAVKYAPPELRVVLYRRSMFRIAEALASTLGVGAIVTGESLGQVASQTVENIAAVNEAVRIPVLRPLIGTNKEEIMPEARSLGTYDISIRPHDDCCSLFLPEHPETRAKLETVLTAERNIEGLAGLEMDALAKSERWVVP
jgi:thiamine biosynthesis protein ThiI